MLFVIERMLSMLNQNLFVELVFIPEDGVPYKKHVPYHMGMTVEKVIEASQITRDYPETLHFTVGIFSTVVDKSTLVKPRDRVEIYRVLRIDPKEKRRQRAKG